MGNKELVAFVGIATTVIWLASDMYLPALPVLDDALNTTEAVINLTLMANMVFLAIGALIGGPISDRFGRRRPMLIALIATTAFNILSAAVTNAIPLIIFRTFAGTAGGFVCSISMALLKDCLPRNSLPTAISTTQSLAVLGPLAAPFLGSALLSVFSWRGIFVALAILNLLCLVWYLPLGETLPPERCDKGSRFGALGLIGKVLRDPAFSVALIAMCLGPLAFGIFMVTCSYVFIDFFHMSYVGYSICYFIAMAVEFCAPFVFNFLLKIMKRKTIMWVIIGLLAFSGVFLLVFGTSSPALFLIGCLPFVIGEGMARPFAFLVLMGNATEHTGAISALITFGMNLFLGMGSPLASLAIWPNYVMATAIPSIACALGTAVLVVILLGPMRSHILD